MSPNTSDESDDQRSDPHEANDEWAGDHYKNGKECETQERQDISGE